MATTARDRRTLSIGVTCVGVILLLGRGLPAAFAWQSRVVSEASDLLDRSASRARRAASLPHLRSAIRERQGRLATIDTTMLSGSTSAAAAASLASQLGDLADASSINVVALQLRSDSASRGPLSHVYVRVSGIGDIVGLSSFLRSIETNESPMTVSELSVAQSEPAAATDRVESLRLDILVAALARTTAAVVR